MTATLTDLDAMLVSALAATPTRTRGGGKDTAVKQAARTLAAEAKAESARMELEANEARVAAYLYQRTDRLTELGKTINACKLREAKGDADAKRERETAELERSILFGLPVDGYDLGPTGRYARSIRYHDRTVGMLAQDVDDVIMRAVEICLMDEALRVETLQGVFPTIGGMYRAVKRAYRDSLDEFRKIKRGFVAVSTDQLRELGVELTERDQSHADHYGYSMVDPATMDWDEIIAVGDLTPRESILKAEAAKAHHELMLKRDALAVETPAPSGLKAASFEVDRILVRQLATGVTLAQLADKLGVSAATVERRIRESFTVEAKAVDMMAEPALVPRGKARDTSTVLVSQM